MAKVINLFEVIYIYGVNSCEKGFCMTYIADHKKLCQKKAPAKISNHAIW